MEGLDTYFVAIVEANPGLRPRVGNPDELRSNRLHLTLDRLKHRVTAPEPGVAEAVDGAVITVLNEEAVVCAALGNKGGINLVVTYEAFAVKMLGAIRQELIFARHQKDAGQSPGWLGVPVVATSHTWENAKNEQSHQDPTLAEALLGEMSDTSRVVFPADWNTTVAVLRAVYASRGTIWTLVVPKLAVAGRFTAAEAERLVADGAVRVRGDGRAALLRLADGLDADHFQVVQDVKVTMADGVVRLELRARDLPDVDVWAAERNSDLFEQEFGKRVELVAAEVV